MPTADRSIARALRGRFAPLAVVTALFLAVATLTRLVLFARNVREVDGPWLAFPLVMSIGFLYDLVAVAYLFAPFALYLGLVPDRVYRSRPHRLLVGAGVPGVKPTGGGRESGVRYADYAIGTFFEAARTRPWFHDTVFVVVGDHGARLYGKEQIPLRSYELPLVFYSPAHIAPRHVDTLASQIDLVPTLLGLLHISYDTVGFGRDILAGDPGDRFVLMSHNHDVGFLRHGHLEVLGMRRTTHEYAYDKETNRQVPEEERPEDLADTVAVYQTAATLFRLREYRLTRGRRRP